MKLEAGLVSSLEKVFLDSSLSDYPPLARKQTALIGERYSFQAVFCWTPESVNCYTAADLTFSAEVRRGGRAHVGAKRRITLSAVGHVPSAFPAPLDGSTEGVLRTDPGLFPDLLTPLAEGEALHVLPERLHSLWIDFRTDGLAPGAYRLKLTAYDKDGAPAAELNHTVEILNVRLPEQELTVTHWLHTDCLANYYGTHVFSALWWKAVKNLFTAAVRSGTNMIYTPLFTPPLDTAVGGERTTVQLVDVFETPEGGYRFDFRKLERWVALGKRCGAKAFEMSHFFTQWGAKHTPKILVRTPEGRLRRKFGWDTDSHGPEYDAFLSAFLPALDRELTTLGIAEITYFHISDEPSLDALEDYARCSATFRKYLKSSRLMDAMSKPEFYERGLLDIPVPFVGHADTFLQKNLRPCWLYYCGSSADHMGRAFGFEAFRNRLTGVQLWSVGADGFLHWGFNFYNSALSLKTLNPYAATDADMRFVSGDSFLVYPGPDGQILDSMRLAVFQEGIEDNRVLRLAEKLLGRDTVERIVYEENGNEPLSLHKLPDRDFCVRLRQRLNLLVAGALN